MTLLLNSQTLAAVLAGCVVLCAVLLFARRVRRTRRIEREHLRRLAEAMVMAFDRADEEERWG